MRLTPSGVVLHPDPVLASACVEVDPSSPEIRGLADRMQGVLVAAGGIGLAAPQVGTLAQLCLVVLPGRNARNPGEVMVNPRLVWIGDEMSETPEGCLSIPGRRFAVVRPTRVTVEYASLSGRVRRLDAEGLLAKCVQHELDHLRGVVVSDIAPEWTPPATVPA